MVTILSAPVPKASLTLEALIKSEEGVLFNQAAQVYNHSFFWNCLAPKAGGAPTGKAGRQR